MQALKQAWYLQPGYHTASCWAQLCPCAFTALLAMSSLARSLAARRCIKAWQPDPTVSRAVAQRSICRVQPTWGVERPRYIPLLAFPRASSLNPGV